MVFYLEYVYVFGVSEKYEFVELQMWCLHVLLFYKNVDANYLSQK